MQSIRMRLGLTFTANRNSACPDQRNNRNGSRRMGESLQQVGGKLKEKTFNGNGQPEGHPRPPFDGPTPKGRNARRTINENGQPVKASRFRTDGAAGSGLLHRGGTIRQETGEIN